MEKNISKIFDANLEPVLKAKEVMSDYIKCINSEKLEKKEGSFSVYDVDTGVKKYFSEKNLTTMDFYLKAVNEKSWKKKISLDPAWIKSVENKFYELLADAKMQVFFEFGGYKFPQNSKMLSRQLTQVLIHHIKVNYLIKKKRGDLESSKFYFDFGRLISDIFIIDKYDWSKIKIKDLISLFSSFDLCDKNLTAFFAKDKKLLNFFNNTFETKFDDKFNNIIEHFLLQVCMDNKKGSVYKNIFYKNKLNIQYLEYSCDFLNPILSSLFDQDNIYENGKTYKVFKPKGEKKLDTNYDLNHGLPSICNYHYSILDKVDFNHFSSTEDVSEGFDIFVSAKNSLLHENQGLNTEITDEFKEILIKQKSNNEFKINQFMLDILITCFVEKRKEFLVEVYGIDILSIFKGKKNYDQIIDWCFDLKDLSKTFGDKKSKYLDKLFKVIFSKKITMFETIKQACIMLCFEKFYFNWFSDSRGRMYTQSSYLNIQGSNISKLLVSFYKYIVPSNFEYANMMLDSYLNKEDIKIGKYFNYQVLHYEIQEKNVSSFFLDASSSGLQMLSIALRSRNLGEKCGLLVSDNKTDLYTRVKDFMIEKIDNDLELKDSIKKIPGFYELINNRKFCKMPIMTIPYNSTKKGRVEQMEESLYSFSFLNGFILNNTDLSEARRIFYLLDNILINWCKKEIPECFEFIKSIRDMIFDEKFENNFISNGYVSYNYKLVLKDVSRRKIGMLDAGKKQKKKISVFIMKPYKYLNDTEKRKMKSKINNSFIANMVHSMDSHIAVNFIKLVSKIGISNYTIHDCFRIEYHFAEALRDSIFQSYKDLFEFDFLAKNKIKSKISGDLFDYDFFVKNIDFDNFVKL